ncbi:MAG: long-chain fatty acid--CoA ligase [Chitinophagales bacterium]|nr:long-chain fatty acid--CoA ligase [Chitinophagales bacterium]MDW8419918.1 long-chain fatty acid--CoA ligase [Chitinophagales bacterium]
MEVKRLFDFLTVRVQQQGNLPFISAKVNKQWKTYTFAETQDISNRVSQLLINLGLQKDDKIAIISTNRPEWNFTDLGSMQLGIIGVPMYPTISEKDYEFIFNDAGIQYAFVGDETILHKVRPLLGRVPTLKGIFTFDRITGANYFWDALPPSSGVNLEVIEERKKAVSEEDLATIIYTSGTTGNPKGVMLTHKNMVSNIHSVRQVTPFTENEKSLSFLPLCHSFERIVFYCYLAFGIHIHYAESLDTIGENLKEVQPYCFTTVPRLLEKVYEKIMAKGNELTGFKRKLFFWSIDLGLQYELGGGKGLWYKLQLAIARKLVFSKWLEALGGRVQFIVTGAAAMQPRLIKLFTAAGINVLEGYGLTETAPVLCVNRIDEQERCIGTVGIPIPGVEIKIAEDGEILARGPNIMKGYYNRPDLTAEVIKDGWFHTGDIGTWVERNGKKFLKITDRKKELFKTAGGKYVAPQVIEEKMKESRYIEQIMVVGGDDKKYVSALIVPSFVNLRDWAKQQGIQVETNAQIVDNDKIKALINEEIDKLNSNFGKWEQIKKFALLDHEWTVEGGELTPTMKLKRKVIYEKYADRITALYAEQHTYVE